MKSTQLVQDIIKEAFGNHLAIGMVTNHPDGRTVCITGGQFLDVVYGRLSNFWYWKEVLDDETLSDIEESGYGWNPNGA